MFFPKLIITDLDNTLLSTKKGITPYSESILEKCNKIGIAICYASARPLRAIQSLYKNFSPDYVISDNGAVISKNNVIMCEELFSAFTCKQIVKHLIADPKVTYFSVETGKCLLVSHPISDMDSSWNIEKSDFSDLKEIAYPKITFESISDNIVNEISRLFPEISVTALEKCFSVERKRYHISKAGISKLSALNFLLSHLQVDYSNTIAFGDDINDIEIIRACKLGIAVNNAIDIVRCSADEICEDCDEDGVARWIEKNMLKQ